MTWTAGVKTERMDKKKKKKSDDVVEAPVVVKLSKKPKSVRKTEIEDVTRNIKNGTFEVVPGDGKSPVWQKFLKIQNTATKELINYVRCRECRSFFSFTGTTSSLIRHNCKETDENEDFQILTEEKLDNIQEIVMEKTITCCAKDLLPIELFWEPGHIEWAQTFVRIGEKYGGVNVKDSIPNINATKRRMNHMKEQSRQFLLDEFEEAYDRGWCSLSMETFDSNGIVKNPKLLTVSVHYFSNELKGLQRRPIFTIDFNETGTGSSNILERIIYHLKVFTGDATNLRKLRIVTPNTELFKEILPSPYKRMDCIVSKLISILNMIFACSFEEKELIRNCRGIADYFEKERLNNRLKSPLKIDNGSWQSVSVMILSITTHYDDVMKILDKREGINFVLDKTKAEEVISFLEPFLAALDDLKSTNYPTANKIALYWDDLNSSFIEKEGQSFGMKNTLSRAKSIFLGQFHLTMDNKIDCFLDPRYRWLKILNDTERAEVYKKVRYLLRRTAETSPASSSENTVSQISAPSENDPPRKKNRFEKYETTMSDTGSKDEVDLYLKSADVNEINFDDEINVMTFWKLYEKKYPGLFQLATSRLNVPACAVTNGHNAFVEHMLTSGNLNDLMVIRNNFEDLKNEELSD